jgi:K+-sensing histidine kinase KdpD
MANVTAVLICTALAVLLVLRELSARRAIARLRKELAEAQTHVSARQQMADVGHFLSGLAHDLKSPLQGVIGNTELMLASADPDHSSADPGHSSAAELNEIRDNAARAAGIVRNLLAFTETSSLTRRWYDVNDIVARAVERCRGELQTAGVRVQVVRADHLPLIWVDGRQIEKVIATLLTLPVSMAPTSEESPDAALMIETRRGPDPDDPLVIEIDDRISDDGGDDASWSGGLSACRSIIEAHAGSLEVNSRDGAGFRFHLELPVAAAGLETVSARQE